MLCCCCCTVPVCFFCLNWLHGFGSWSKNIVYQYLRRIDCTALGHGQKILSTGTYVVEIGCTSIFVYQYWRKWVRIMVRKIIAPASFFKTATPITTQHNNDDNNDNNDNVILTKPAKLWEVTGKRFHTATQRLRMVTLEDLLFYIWTSECSVVGISANRLYIF